VVIIKWNEQDRVYISGAEGPSLKYDN